MSRNSSVLERLLSLLTDTLKVNDEQMEEFDSHCVQWLTLLLSHVLSSDDTRNRDSNIFVPSPPPIPSTPVIDKYSNMTSAKISRHILRLEEAKDMLKSLFLEVSDPETISELTSMMSRLKKMEKKLNKISKAVQQRESDQGGKGSDATSQTDSHSGSMGMNLQLSDVVLKTSSEGLVCLLVKHCRDSDWDKVPIVCKVRPYYDHYYYITLIVCTVIIDDSCTVIVSPSCLSSSLYIIPCTHYALYRY